MLWLDGHRLEGPSAPFDLSDRGLLLGDGVFDTALVVNGAVVFSGRHLDRLGHSCACLGIPFDRAAVAATLAEAAAATGTGTLRTTVTRGPAPRGLLPPAHPAPQVIVAANQGAPASLWRPVRVAVSDIRRNETSPLSRHKCLAYLDAILALKDAAGQGADEVLFRNIAGNLACCATGNLFVLRGDILRTPPLTDGVLAGIVRQMVLDLAPSLALTPVEASLTPADPAAADAGFMTNSLRLISPILRTDGAPLTPRAGAVLGSLATALIRRIRRDHGPCPWIERGPAYWPLSP